MMEITINFLNFSLKFRQDLEETEENLEGNEDDFEADLRQN